MALVWVTLPSVPHLTHCMARVYSKEREEWERSKGKGEKTLQKQKKSSGKSEEWTGCSVIQFVRAGLTLQHVKAHRCSGSCSPLVSIQGCPSLPPYRGTAGFVDKTQCNHYICCCKFKYVFLLVYHKWTSWFLVGHRKQYSIHNM